MPNPSAIFMKTSPNPMAATGRCTGRLRDPRMDAADPTRNPIPPAGAKRRARSALIEAIAELMAMPGPDAHARET
jgi:hypothetical protein